jgi:hypothetical protein
MLELLAVLLFVTAVVLAGVALRPGREKHARKSPWRPAKSSVVWTGPDEFSKSRNQAAPGYTSDFGNAAFQLNAVMKAAFQRQRVMNGYEYNVFKIVENEARAIRNGYRVFAQTSLGEVLRSKDPDAFRCVNSKRVDILVIDREGLPKLAIEYQGAGHYQGDAAARDAVKKEALRKAGVAYMEVTPEDSDEQIRLRIREHLGMKPHDPRPPSPPEPNGGPPAHSSKLVPQLH